MITLDPRPAPPGAGVIRDILRPGPVVVHDPSGRHSFFGAPQVRDQVSVRQLGDVVLCHVIRLGENVDFICDPSWVSPCPTEVVPLRLEPASGAQPAGIAGAAR